MGWGGAALLLAGCQERPSNPAEATVGAPTAPVATSAADTVEWVRPPLPPDTVLGAARRAVLRQATLPPAATQAPLIPTLPLLPRRGVPLVPGQTGIRRYVGTLGGQLVVVELGGQPASRYDPACFSGSYYAEWGGQPYTLATPENFRPDQPLLLIEQFGEYDGDTTAVWQAEQPLSPVLTGTWTDRRTRRTARFALRESYAGAVQYELLDEELRGRDSCRWGSESYRRPFVQATWLHLLGEAARRPALRHLQCPPPRQRRQQLREDLPAPGCEAGTQFGIFQSVSLNYTGDNLLSYTFSRAEDMGGPYPNEDAHEERLVDLATGRECRPEDWLRSERLPQLRRLFTTYLVNDPTGRHNIPAVPGPDKLGNLPPLRLTGLGLAFRLGEIGAPHVTANVTITVPYTQLGPYVLPGTPLARLVAARTRAQP